jgi:hypothetical protein
MTERTLLESQLEHGQNVACAKIRSGGGIMDERQNRGNNKCDEMSKHKIDQSSEQQSELGPLLTRETYRGIGQPGG